MQKPATTRGNNWERALRVVLILGTLLLVGCGISVTKDERGQDKKVDIVSPFGSLHVNTDVDMKALGLPIYPGARRREEAKDKHGANVNIDSSLFGVKVVAVEYESDDAADKVLSFYRNALKQYGNVIECKGHSGGQSARPGESRELTCGGDEARGHINIDIDKDPDAVQLKVGTTDRQHIVAVRSADGKTRFGLVYLQTRGKNDSI